MNTSTEFDQKKTDKALSLVAVFIHKHPKEAISLLKEFKFYTEDNASTEEIAKAVSKAIRSSKLFTAALVDDIITSHGGMSAAGQEGYFNDDGGSSVSDLLKNGSSLISGLGSIFNGKSQASTAASNAQSAQANAQAEQAKAQQQLVNQTAALKLASTKTGSVGLYIGLAVAAIAIIGGVILVMKLRKGDTSVAAA